MNIVLCADGTGNTAGKARGTNVWRLYSLLDRGRDPDKGGMPVQIALHDDGVGTETFKPIKMLGGAFGWGLSQNVRDLYGFLVRAYRPGDRIYLFGFSRGAYTVRMLSGLVFRCGVVDANHCPNTQALNARVAEAFRTFQKGKDADVNAFRQKYGAPTAPGSPDTEIPITFMGLWDTVDAVGVPFDGLRDIINVFFDYRFPDRIPAPNVRHGCQALSIDDARRSFHPVLWDESKLAPGQIVEQVWFAGVHSNVGGGYVRDGLALVALHWMIDRARRAGLRFDDAAAAALLRDADPHGRLHDSRLGLAAYYRYETRDVGAICRDQAHCKPRIHLSAIERINQHRADYAPGRIPSDIEVVAAEPEISWSTGAAASGLATQIKEMTADRVTLLEGSAVYERRQFWLYYAFLAVSVLLVLNVGLLSFTTRDVAAVEPHWPWDLAARLGAALVPGAVADLVRLLLTRPEILLAGFAAFIALFGLRQTWRGMAAGFAERSWLAVFPRTGNAQHQSPAWPPRWSWRAAIGRVVSVAVMVGSIVFLVIALAERIDSFWP